MAKIKPKERAELNKRIGAFKAKQAELVAIHEELAEQSLAIQRILEAAGKRQHELPAEDMAKPDV